MSYADLDDLLAALPRNELIQLTDVESTGEVNTDVVASAGEEADAWIDGYLARRRTVPVSPVPTALKMMAVRARIYFLYLRVRSVTEDVRNQHGDDRKWLEAYAEGKGSLGDEAEPTTPGGAEYSADDREFTRRKMKGF